MVRFTGQSVLWGLLAFLWMAQTAAARERPSLEDADAVKGSDLIVVGGIKPGSIKVTVVRLADSLGPTTYQATLLIHQVVKGELREEEIPVIFSNGLALLVDGKSKNDANDINISTFLPKGTEPGSIQVFDYGNSAMSFSALINDARRDTIWLLRKGDDGLYGISAPEEVQPAALLPYFQCLLAADPETAVRAYIQSHPEVAVRAMRFLERREIERIATELDARIRVEHLLPYYVAQGSGSWRARQEIVAAGRFAGPYLLSVFEDWRNAGLRRDVMGIWGEIEYRGGVDAMIQTLRKEDKFWAVQKLTEGWWSDSTEGQSAMQYRQESYGVIQAAVHALGLIGDARAREAIELTRKRWEGFPVDHAVVKACDEALALLK